MSFWSSILPFVKKADADVEAAAKKITDKAAADVAALRNSAALAKVKSDNAAKLAAFEAALADYKARLAAAPPTPSA